MSFLASSTWRRGSTAWPRECGSSRRTAASRAPDRCGRSQLMSRNCGTSCDTPSPTPRCPRQRASIRRSDCHSDSSHWAPSPPLITWAPRPGIAPSHSSGPAPGSGCTTVRTFLLSHSPAHRVLPLHPLRLVVPPGPAAGELVPLAAARTGCRCAVPPTGRLRNYRAPSATAIQ